MRRIAFAIGILLISLLFYQEVKGQGGFQNLDFESGSLVPIPDDPYNRVSLDSALPYWTAHSGAALITAVLHNNVYLDSTGVAILDAANQTWPGGPIQGGFSVLLQAGAELGSGGTRQADVSLVQSAVVPFSARSLWFLGRASSPNFAVSLGGANLEFLAFPMGGTTRYGADISGFAGQTLPLNFTVFAPSPHGQNNLYLDSIEFSSLSVPEPSTVALLALAGALGCLYFRRKAE